MLKDKLTPNAVKAPASLVMAWAQDIQTGEPVYIMELDARRTKSNCGCECPSCKLPLTAVNAAKNEYQRRPHFRHPDHSQKSDCMYQAARLAALQLLRDQGFIQLPKLQKVGRYIGESGKEYEQTIERPPERKAIRDFNFQDRTSAILTLDDGRQLRIQLIGNGATAIADGSLIATISFEVNDPSIASMSIVELRSRISLVSDNLCWQTHWQDIELQLEADSAARKEADFWLDLTDTHAADLQDVDPKFRRETILHLEVKKILAQSKEIRVPVLTSMVRGEDRNHQIIEKTRSRASEVIRLLEVQLEKRFGSLIPDVMASTEPEQGGMLLIEVTVTNEINQERVAKFQELNIPALEIDLSFSMGRVTREQLKKLVVDGLGTKRWLHHPEIAAQRQLLEVDLQAQLEEIKQAEAAKLEQRRRVLAIPLQDIAQRYLSAVRTLVDLQSNVVLDDSVFTEIEDAKQLVALEASKLVTHGYEEAIDKRLIDGRMGIIPKIMAIKSGEGVGYRLDIAMKIMSNLKHSSGSNLSNHTIFLIAENVYRFPIDEVVPTWYKEWTEQIKLSIKSGEAVYLRDRKFDRLLSILFPGMATSLSKVYGLNTKKKITVTSTQSISASNSKKLVETNHARQVRESYKNGGFRHYAPRVEFFDILNEAQAINQGEAYSKWFEIWNDRYNLFHDLKCIALYLYASGFQDAILALNKWNAEKQQVKHIVKENSVVQGELNSLRSNQVQPAVNGYELLKGRKSPRV